MLRPRKSSGCFISSRSLAFHFGTSLPYVARPSSGYLPSSTGSIHQALFHSWRSSTENIAWRAASMSSGLSLAGWVGLRRHHVADLAVLGVRAQRLHRLGVRAHAVVRRHQVVRVLELVAGRVHAVAQREPDEALGLVLRDPDLDAIAELVAHQRRVLGEPVGRVAVEPAAALVQRLRVVPVEQRAHRLDAVLVQLVDEAAVKVEPLRR